MAICDPGKYVDSALGKFNKRQQAHRALSETRPRKWHMSVGLRRESLGVRPRGRTQLYWTPGWFAPETRGGGVTKLVGSAPVQLTIRGMGKMRRLGKGEISLHHFNNFRRRFLFSTRCNY